MNVGQVLKLKLADPLTVGAEATIQDTASLLARARKGLALVCDADGKLRGVISVIDINRAVAEHGGGAATMPVSEVMTTDFCACGREEGVDQALELMNRRGIRHLPVIADGQLVGLVNIRSLMEAKYTDAEIETDEMRRLIHGVGYR